MQSCLGFPLAQGASKNTQDPLLGLLSMRIAQYRITQFVLGDHLVYN